MVSGLEVDVQDRWYVDVVVEGCHEDFSVPTPRGCGVYYRKTGNFLISLQSSEWYR